jgi:hypothetical protein
MTHDLRKFQFPVAKIMRYNIGALLQPKVESPDVENRRSRSGDCILLRLDCFRIGAFAG